MEETARPLKISIVGAGIGGLTAAVGLRRNGHRVTLFEQSILAKELGAALNICPNSNGVLRGLDILPETFGGVTGESVVEISSRGIEAPRRDQRHLSKLYRYPWQTVHRVRLHEMLKTRATSPEGVGPPAILRTASRVVDVDPSTATVTLENGEGVAADVVIGADGIHSKITRTAVCRPSEPPKLFPTGKAAFRFMVPRKTARADPVAKRFCERLSEMVIISGNDRKIVMYPCEDNTLLNLACIHPELKWEATTDQWNKEGKVEDLLKVYGEFHPDVLALLSLAQPGTIKVWRLLDMEKLPTWVNKKVALLGDAAHPFTPHQGQGAGVAIEDGAAIATVLPAGTSPSQVPERLKLYEKIRYERAHRLQQYSRDAGKDVVDGAPPFDMYQYVAYCFGHNEWENSERIFKEYLAAQEEKL